MRFYTKPLQGQRFVFALWITRRHPNRISAKERYRIHVQRNQEIYSSRFALQLFPILFRQSFLPWSRTRYYRAEKTDILCNSERRTKTACAVFSEKASPSEDDLVKSAPCPVYRFPKAV